MTVTRRRVFGVGAAVAAAGTVVVTGGGRALAQGVDVDDDSIPTTSEQARRKIARVYQREVERAGGIWSTYISVTDPDGTPLPAVSVDADKVVTADSVNKIAVATAVLDKIDRGLLTLDQRVEVTSDIVIQDTDGIIALDGAYPSSITLGHVLAMLLTVSDNTCVRLCGLVAPALEINQILRDKGFMQTQVRPVANPNRFFLGTTTANETHTLLQKLVSGTLLSPASTAYLLNVLRSTSAFTDGIRLNLTTNERLRVATKAGWFAARRAEAGIMFDSAGKPMATYALFADGPYNGDATVDADNFAASHPAIRARAVLGRTMFNAVSRITANTPKAFGAKGYHAYEGD
jgi:beta-lactamase class A